jgi:hypothetical protein
MDSAKSGSNGKKKWKKKSKAVYLTRWEMIIKVESIQHKVFIYKINYFNIYSIMDYKEIL